LTAARNVLRNSAVCLLVIDPDNPGHWIEIQGVIGELRDEEHACSLSVVPSASASAARPASVMPYAPAD
jgi:hypothetical protein